MNYRRPKKWEKHEQSVLGNKDGIRVPGSGACPGKKGDVQINSLHEYLVECKSTEGLGIRVTKAMWNKISKEAFEAQRLPLICLDIDGIRLAVCDESLFWELNGEEE